MKNATLKIILLSAWMLSAFVIFGQSTTKSFTSTVPFQNTDNLQMYNAIRLGASGTASVVVNNTVNVSSVASDSTNKLLRVLNNKLTKSSNEFQNTPFADGLGRNVFIDYSSETSIGTNSRRLVARPLLGAVINMVFSNETIAGLRDDINSYFWANGGYALVSLSVMHTGTGFSAFAVVSTL